MTVRNPLKSLGVFKSLASGDVYRFFGNDGGDELDIYGLRRYTVAQAEALISSGDLASVQVQWRGVNMDGDPAVDPLNALASSDVAGTGETGYEGYIFVITEDANGNEVDWEAWWPKRQKPETYYVLPESFGGGTLSYSQLLVLYREGQFPGNFFLDTARTTYWTSKADDIQLQEEPNAGWYIAALVNKWMEETPTNRTGNTKAVQGVELQFGVANTTNSFSAGTAQGDIADIEYLSYTGTKSMASRTTWYDTGTSYAEGGAYIMNIQSGYGITDPGDTFANWRGTTDAGNQGVYQTGFVESFWDAGQYNSYSGPVSYPVNTSTNIDLRTTGIYVLEQWIGKSGGESYPNEDDRPLFYNNGSMQRMSQADMDDTFIKPAIIMFMGGAQPDGWTGSVQPYIITTSSRASGYTRMGGNAFPLYRDYVANEASYLAGNPPETKGQTTRVNTYYLFKQNGLNMASYESRKYIYYKFDSSTNSMVAIDPDDLVNFLYPRFLYYMRTQQNYRLRYSFRINGNLTTTWKPTTYRSIYLLGQTIQDSRLDNVTRTLRYYKAGEDDYRYQYVPTSSGQDGSTIVINANQYTLFGARY